jgi:hypothetical protein
MNQDVIVSILQVASALGTGGLLTLTGWRLARALLCVSLVLIMCRAQSRTSGRYPSLDEATTALEHVLGATQADWLRLVREAHRRNH